MSCVITQSKRTSILKVNYFSSYDVRKLKKSSFEKNVFEVSKTERSKSGTALPHSIEKIPNIALKLKEYIFQMFINDLWNK